jgi:hypothetical protein
MAESGVVRFREKSSLLFQQKIYKYAKWKILLSEIKRNTMYKNIKLKKFLKKKRETYGKKENNRVPYWNISCNDG